MARKRKARPQQVEQAVENALSDLENLLLSSNAAPVLENWIAYHRDKQAFYTALLEWLRITPFEEVKEAFAQQKKQLVSGSTGMPILEEDLPAFSQLLKATVNTIGTGSVDSPDNKSLRVFVNRLISKEPARPRIRAEFVEAYQIRRAAQSKGKRVTIRELTEKLIPYEYGKDSDNALRNMERGIKRAEEVFQLCVKLGIPFPP
jgi:hypothetical protein